MKARVAGLASSAAEPVRARIPFQFTIIGHAVSVNASLTVSAERRMVHTKEARDWSKLMVKQIREQWGLMLPWDQEVFLIAEVYISANTMDEDNALKPLQDALQEAGVIKNDRLVRRATITKHVDRNRPRIEVHLYPSTLTPL